MAKITQLKRRRSRGTALLLLGIAVALCLQTFITAPSIGETTLFHDDGSNNEATNTNSESSSNNNDSDKIQMEMKELMEDEATMNRLLMGIEVNYVVEEDYDAAAAAGAASLPADHDHDLQQPPPTSLAPYTLLDTLQESEMFEYTFCILIYDPTSDEFLVYYNKYHKWKNGNKKLWKSIRYVSYMLRTTFPHRFTPSSPELVLAIGSGDYPHVKRGLLPYKGTAPVLMFGSSFSDSNEYENMMAMPMPEQHHLFCFEEYMEKGRPCKEMTGDELMFGDELGLEWDDLTPQLVWRGTDFGYLPTLQPRDSLLVHPPPENFIRTVNKKGSKRTDAIRALMEEYDTLLPRWKGAALTAHAELHPGRRNNRLPWANIKFSAYLDAGKSSTVDSPKYAPWQSVGIGVDRGMSPSTLATYKYHIDLGGGGGTTWSGTIEKLAMPGLLFHHVTPTKDYIHDRLVPWKHYVPVAPDLKDLRSKFDWAEGHPMEAMTIADAGTEFMRELGTPEGFGRMFEEDFVEPMRRVIEAYRPVASTHPDAKSWKDVLRSIDDCRVIPVMQCSGLELEGSCHLVPDVHVKAWSTEGGFYKGPN